MKVTSSYRVRVVVDAAFGERLAEFPENEPVWIVDSPIDMPVAQRLWKDRSGKGSLFGISVLNHWADATPEDEFLGVLDSVDEHHGAYSVPPTLPKSKSREVKSAPRSWKERAFALPAGVVAGTGRKPSS